MWISVLYTYDNIYEYDRQASKAAQLRFYETLRAELGSEVGITILTPGYVESEITKGKGVQKGGEVAVDEEARDVSSSSHHIIYTIIYYFVSKNISF